jgi:hypothetical protein
MSPRESAIRVRIERILSGSNDPHEIAQIFADLRFLGCPQEVRDLADFSAHRPEKDRGRLLDDTSKLYKELRMHLQGQLPLNVRPAYTDEQVANALSSFCIALGIFRPSELADISRLKMMVGLYGLVSIHGCVFGRFQENPSFNPQFRRKIGNRMCGAIDDVRRYPSPGCADLFQSSGIFYLVTSNSDTRSVRV